MPVTIGATVNLNQSTENQIFRTEEDKELYPKSSGGTTLSIDYMDISNELWEQSIYRDTDIFYDPIKERENCGDPEDPNDPYPCKVQAWYYDLPFELREAMYKNHGIYLADFMEMAYPHGELLDEFNENTELLFWCDNLDIENETYDLFLGLCQSESIFFTVYLGSYRMLNLLPGDPTETANNNLKLN